MTSEVAGVGMSEEENKAIARRFIKEVCNEGHVEAIDELATEDFVCHGPGPIEFGREGLAWFLRFQAGIRAATGKSGHREIEAVAAEGDIVMVWTAGEVPIPAERYFPEEMLTTMRRNQAATGMTVLEQVQPMGASVFRLAGGKVAEQWLFTGHPLSFSHLSTFEGQSRSERVGGHKRKQRRR